MKIKTLFNKEFRAEVSEVESHWKSSLIIRVITIILLIVDACVFSFQPIYPIIVWFMNIGVAFSGVWTLVVVMCRLFMVKPIHPGVHVGFELVAWTGLTVVISFGFSDIFSSYALQTEYPEYYSEPFISADVYTANLVGCSLLMIVGVLHFYLFVRACIDTSRRRSDEIATRAATIAAQIVKNMESRGTFFRRDSDISYGYSPFEEGASGHILGLENLTSRNDFRGNMNDSQTLNQTGLAPLQSSRLSQISRARSGRTAFSQARTQYSHTRSLSVPVPTSPRSLRTALTDEPSLFRLDQC